MSEPMEMTARELIDVLYRNGFRPCSIPACNCGSWHAVEGWPQRFSEIEEATNDYWRNGETLLDMVKRIVQSEQQLRENTRKALELIDRITGDGE
jgi:hypothetical protein